MNEIIKLAENEEDVLSKLRRIKDQNGKYIVIGLAAPDGESGIFINQFESADEAYAFASVSVCPIVAKRVNLVVTENQLPQNKNKDEDWLDEFKKYGSV